MEQKRVMYKNRVANFPLPTLKDVKEDVIVSLTSYKHRLKQIIPTLQSLNNQTRKPDKIVLYIAYEDKDLVYEEIEKYCEVHYCEDILSHKKFNGFWEYPDCYVVTADDDLIYNEDWLETLLRASQLAPGCVAAHNTFILTGFGFNGVATRRYNSSSLQGRMNMYVMTGAGVLLPPGVANKITELKDAWKYSPHCDEKPLSVILRAKKIPVVATSFNSGEHHRESYRNNISLWDMYNCKHQKDRWEESKEFLKSFNIL